MQDGRKAVWSIPYVSVAFFPSLKHNFLTYHSSKVSWRPDCIFEIHQLWQSGFSRVYSNSCCSCSFEPKILKIDQSSHKMYSNKMVNFQESTTILNACTKKSGNLLKEPRTYKFQTIQFSISTQFSSIWPIDRTLSGATIPGQSGPRSDGNKGVLCIPQSSSITETSPSYCLMSYPGHSLEESYSSAGMQSVYSIAPADWALSGSVTVVALVVLY